MNYQIRSNMKGRILLVLATLAIMTIACVNSKNKNTDQNEPLVMAEKTADRALRLAETNRNNPDSLALAIELLDQAIALVSQSQTSDYDKPGLYHTLYGHKSQIQCYQGKFDAALTTLEDAEKKYGVFWMNQFLIAIISDFKGDTVSANLNYERVIDYCDYKLKEMDQNSQEYLNMFVTCITAKMLRYGIEEGRGDIEKLKARNDYTEGSSVYYLVVGFENWNKEAYLKSLWGIKE